MQIEISPDTQTRLNALMDYIGTTAKDADGFVREQAPQVAQEIVAWHFWSAACLAGVLSVLSLTLLLWGINSVRIENAKEGRGRWDPDCARPNFTVIGMVAAIAFGVFTIVNSYQAVRACVAPRLVILDYIKGVK